MRLLAPAPTARQLGVSLDADQARAVAAAVNGQGLLIAGAPGAGKTSVLTQAAIQILQNRNDATSGAKLASTPTTHPLLYIAPSRRAAGDLRTQISAQLDRPLTAPVVRTASAVAFSILKQFADVEGAGAPRLISGPEQDRILGDLLEGHLTGEGVKLPVLPGLTSEVLQLKGFRHELRDILMRAREHGVTPKQLDQLANQHQRPMWGFAAAIYGEYEANLALRAFGSDLGKQIDPAGVIADAAQVLTNWNSLTSAPEPLFCCILVDDYQEVTAATAQMLAAFQKNGSQLVLAGNPDLATQGFRGASPALFGRATAPVGSELGAFGLTPMPLRTVWRQSAAEHGGQLLQAIERVVARIPTLGGPLTRGATLANLPPELRQGQAEVVPLSELVPQSSPEPSLKVELELLTEPYSVSQATETESAPSGAMAVKLRTKAQESAWIAAELRREHYLNQTPWGQMAVICRSGTQLSDLRRDLLSAGVPVATLGADVPLHQEPAVAPILTLLGVVAGTMPLTVENLVALTTSPVGGLDTIGLRRLRQALIAQERAQGGTRSSDQLLLAAATGELPMPKHSQQMEGLQRVTQALAAGQKAFAEQPVIGTVMWAIWEATGLAEPWRDAALAGGNVGMRADRDLDAMMALFKAAEFFSERNPGAGVARFIEYLQSQDVPADSVAQQGHTGAVSALTPTGAAGREWDLVVVAGVQDGAWPDLRLRDSMFGTQTLVDLITDRANPEVAKDLVSARMEVFADETRAFTVAISRAKRRLIVTAVEDGDEAPSVYLNLITEQAPLVTAGYPLDLRGVVTQARIELLNPGKGDNGAAQLLAALWAQGVAAANPATWYGAAESSTSEPLWQPAGPTVPVSPSKVEAVSNCPLRWVLESSGASNGPAVSQSVGNLIHNLAQKYPAGTYEQLRGELDRRWPELNLGENWMANRERTKAEAMVYRLAKYLETAAPAESVEAEFRLVIDNAVLAGRADRIEKVGDGKYLVVDLKTGATPPTAAAAAENPQLKAYQLALAEGAFGELPSGAQSGGAQLVYVSTGKEATIKQQPQLDQTAQQEARQLIIDVAGTMAGAEFAARLGPNCRSCSLKFACPLQAQGRQVIE